MNKLETMTLFICWSFDLRHKKNEASIGRIQDGQDDNWMGHTWLLSNEQNDKQGDK